MSKKYKVVIIGFAHMHVNEVGAYFAEHPRIDLAACADTVPVVPEVRVAPYTRQWNVEFAKKNIGIKKVYDDYIEMLEKEKPDLAFVTSENIRHADIAEECAKRGVSVCLEKPMAANLSHALRMSRAAKSYGTGLIVNWPIAWKPELHLMKKLADEGRIGKLIEFKVRASHTGPLGPGAAHRGVTDAAETLSGFERAQTWWHKSCQGGGVMLDYCCNGCLLSHWYFGKPGIAAFGMRGNYASDWCDADDNASMLVRFEDSFATIECSWTTYFDPVPKNTPTLYGTEGVMMAGVIDGEISLKILEPSGEVVILKPDPLPEQLQDIAKAYVYYMDNGELPHKLLEPDFNLHCMAMLDAGLRSADSGKMELVNNAVWNIG